jgi:foldase protein PrsA
VATVNGQAISRVDFDKRLEAGGTQARTTLFQLIQSVLIDQYAAQNHIVISDEQVNKKLDEIKAHYPNGQFASMLQGQGLTEDDARKLLRRQLVINQSIDKNVHVTEADVKAYFDKNRAQFDTPAQIKAKHILVKSKNTADEVEAKLKAGGDFTALAKQYSTDPTTKDHGGELGMFSKGQMVPAFEHAALTQPIGVVGDVVKSPFGYHIIVVEERTPAQVATLDKSADKIREQLTQQQEQLQIPEFLAELRGKANITINDPLLKDALPPPATPPAPNEGTSPAPAASAAPATSAAPVATPTTK